jgi:hypothetical protein
MSKLFVTSTKPFLGITHVVIYADSAMNAHRLLCMMDDKPDEEIIQSFELGDWYVVGAKAKRGTTIGMLDRFSDWREEDIRDWREAGQASDSGLVGHATLEDLKGLLVPANE